jgi:hypothetical protein
MTNQCEDDRTNKGRTTSCRDQRTKKDGAKIFRFLKYLLHPF